MAGTSNIDTIFLMLGGVVTQRLEVAVNQVLSGCAALAHPSAQVALRDLGADLALGRLDAAEFCARVIHLAQADLNATALPGRVLDVLTPTPGLCGFLAEVQPRYRVWLIADYPQAWLGNILSKLHLQPLFPSGNILSPAPLHAPKFMPYLIPAMLEACAAPLERAALLEQCLFVDAQPANTSAAIRNGLNATIFVDVPRLRRNLVLRSML